MTCRLDRQILGITVAVFCAVTIAAKSTSVTATEKMVTYHSSRDGSEATGFLVTPDRKGKGAAVLIVHDWTGLSEKVKNEARKYTKEGYTVFVADTFNGQKPSTPEEAEPIIRNLYEPGNHGIVFRNLNDARTLLENHESVDPNRIAILGWGYGAVWSVHSAIAGFDYQSAVVYSSSSDALKTPAAFKLEWLHAPVLLHNPDGDSAVDKKVVASFHERAVNRNKNSQFYYYGNAKTGFALNGDNNYDAKSANEAFKRTLAFLTETLTKNPTSPGPLIVCAADIRRLCADFPRGKDWVKQCLVPQLDKISSQCQSVGFSYLK